MKRTNNQVEYAVTGNQRLSIVQARAVSDINLSDGAFRTLCALGVFGDRDGWCWPSQKRLAAMLHKSRQAVSKDLKQLKELGYIEIEAQNDDNTGAQTVNKMRILFDKIPAPPQLQVAPPSTNQVEAPATSGVALNAPINGLNTTPKADLQEVQQVYTAVTNNMALPSGQRDSIMERLGAIIKNKGIQGSIEYCRPFFEESLKRRRQDGRFYSRLNDAWLDWAVAGEVTAPIDKQPSSNGRKPAAPKTYTPPAQVSNVDPEVMAILRGKPA